MYIPIGRVWRTAIDEFCGGGRLCESRIESDPNHSLSEIDVGPEVSRVGDIGNGLTPQMFPLVCSQDAVLKNGFWFYGDTMRYWL